MTSLFDSTVYQARRAIEWAEIDLEYFLKDIALNGEQVKLEVRRRDDLSTRYWWSITWKGEDGEMHSQSAQTLQLCLWRAAIREKQIREKQEKQYKKSEQE